MRVTRIYVPAPLAVGERGVLPEAAANHVVRVLRLRAGDPLVVFNGAGGEYRGVLEQAGRAVVARLDAFDPREAESPLDSLLAQAVIKGEAMDYALQKAVELGVGVIQPVLTERGPPAPPRERWARRLAHWRGVVAAACEQCGRNRVPAVREPMPLGGWLAEHDASRRRLMLDPRAELGLHAIPAPRAVSVLSGPEGGLSPVERDLALGAGFIGVRLGPRVLRAETAGVAALAALQTLWGDFT